MDGMGSLSGLIQQGQPAQGAGAPPEAPAPAGGGNPLLGLVQPGGMMKPKPQPSHEQVVAALHRFTEVRRLIRPLLENPETGKKSIRGKLVDVAAQMLGERVLTLPEAMNVLKIFPNEPGEQKAWLMKAMNNTKMAMDRVIADYAAQGPLDEGAELAQWNLDGQADHFDGLMKHYG